MNEDTVKIPEHLSERKKERKKGRN